MKLDLTITRSQEEIMAQRPVRHFTNEDTGECYVKVGDRFMECGDYVQEGGRAWKHAEIAFDLDGNNVLEPTEPCPWHSND
jgi:hypothetical protein